VTETEEAIWEKKSLTKSPPKGGFFCEKKAWQKKVKKSLTTRPLALATLSSTISTILEKCLKIFSCVTLKMY
jgi:hypothetical protein